MSTSIKLVNWQGIAPSNFKWAADFRDIIVGNIFYLMLNTIPMTSVWTIPVVVGGPGYYQQIACYINVRLYNTTGAKVWDSGLVLVNFQNNKNYEFDCVYKQMLEVIGVSGHIITKKLKYDSTVADIPVSASVALNSQGQVQITARNDGPSPAMMAFNCTIWDPGGSPVGAVFGQSGYVDPGADWLSGWYSTMSLSQVGTYTTQITLSVWDGSQWVQVDQWSGNLCTVTAAPPTESIFSNFSVTYAKL